MSMFSRFAVFVCAVANGVLAQTIVEVVDSLPDQFSKLREALTAAELVETFSSPGNFTVFAPTNEAFNKLDSGVLTALLANKTQIVDVLQYHVVPSIVYASEVVTLTEATMLNDKEIMIHMDGSSVKLNINVGVTGTDVNATNGVIHTIDTVLMAPTQTIADIAIANDFSTLVTALQAAGLVDTFSGDGDFTVLAPTNAAFDKLEAGVLAGLLNDTAALTNLLQYHVIPGRVPSSTVKTLSEATTLNGQTISITLDGSTIKLNTDVSVTSGDILGTNGIVHVIDTVLTPPPTPTTTATPSTSATSATTAVASLAASKSTVAAVFVTLSLFSLM